MPDGAFGHGTIAAIGPQEDRIAFGKACNVLGWLLRIVPRPRPAAASATSAVDQAASGSQGSSSDAGGDSGLGDIVADVDFDPGEGSAEAPLTWQPGPPLFSRADRADIAALDPIDVSALASTITSELLASIDQVPPFPLVANKLIELSSRTNVRADVIERLVVQDPVIAAKVISAANSPYFGRSTAVTTVEHAIRTVGLHQVTQIAIAAAAAVVFDTRERVAFDAMVPQQQAAWKHALSTARGAAWLATWVNVDVQRAYIAGLLHDIGKPIALRGIGFALINGRLMTPPGAALARAAVDEAHLDVGEMFADAWRLGDELTAIIADHHSDESADMLHRIVRLASGVDDLCCDPAHADNLLAQILSVAVALGLNQQKLAELAEVIGRSSVIGLTGA